MSSNSRRPQEISNWEASEGEVYFSKFDDIIKALIDSEPEVLICKR
jgi:hypothetical protein